MEDLGFNSDFLRGHINTIVLKSLFNGDKYGLEICKELEKNSNGTFILKQPSLYSALKRLESIGLITSYWKDSSIGGKRHYYAITPKGISTFNDNQNEWAFSRQMIDSLISIPSTGYQANHLSTEASQIRDSINCNINDIKENLSTIPNLNNQTLHSETFPNTNENEFQGNFFQAQKSNINEELNVFKKSISDFYNANVINKSITDNTNIVNENITNNNQNNQNEPFSWDKEKREINDSALLKADKENIIPAETSSILLPQDNLEHNDGHLLSPFDKILSKNEIKKIQEDAEKKELEELIKKQKEEFFESSQLKDDAVLIREDYEPKSEQEAKEILNNIYFKSSKDGSNLNDLVDKKNNKNLNSGIAKNIFDSNLEEVSDLNTSKKYSITSFAKSNGAPAFSKSFVKLNFYNLLKNFFLFAFVLLELGISYFIFNKFNIKSHHINIVYLVCLIVAVLPLVFSLLSTIIRPNKKKNIKYLKTNIIVELLVIIISIAIIYSVCKIAGISNIFDPMNLQYFLIPSIVIINLLTNHLLSFLVQKIDAIYA